MPSRGHGPVARLFRGLISAAAGLALTLAIFTVLPLMQTISTPPPRDLLVRAIETADLPPPPPAPMEPEEEKESEEEPPPELAEEAQPLDLSELELALSPSLGEGAVGDFKVRLADHVAAGGGGESGGADRVFSMAELDQRPRVVMQAMPRYPAELRKKSLEGTVYVIFLVDRTGRVVQPKVEKSTNPAFEPAAIEAVRQWRFEPGTRNGEKVQFKMRVPITFNAG